MKFNGFIKNIWDLTFAYRAIQVSAFVYFLVVSVLLWGAFLFYTFSLQKAEIQREGYWASRNLASEISQDLQGMLALAANPKITARPFTHSKLQLNPANGSPTATLGINQFMCYPKRNKLGQPSSLTTYGGKAVNLAQIGLRRIPGRNIRLLFSQASSRGSVEMFVNGEQTLCRVNLDLRVFLDIQDKVFGGEKNGAFAVAATSSNFFIPSADSKSKTTKGLLFSSDPTIIGPTEYKFAKKNGSGGNFAYFSLLNKSLTQLVEGFGEAPIAGSNSYIMIRWATNFDIFRNAYVLKYAFLGFALQALLIFLFIFLESRKIYMPLFAINSYIQSLRRSTPDTGIEPIPVPSVFPWSFFNESLNSLISSIKSLWQAKQKMTENQAMMSMYATDIQGLLYKKMDELGITPSGKADGKDIPVVAEFWPHEDLMPSDSFNSPTGGTMLYSSQLDSKGRVILIIPSAPEICRLVSSYLTMMLRYFAINDVQRFIAEICKDLESDPQRLGKALGGIALCVTDLHGRIVMTAGSAEWTADEASDNRYIKISNLSPGFRESLQRYGRPTFDPMTDLLEVYRTPLNKQAA